MLKPCLELVGGHSLDLRLVSKAHQNLNVKLGSAHDNAISPSFAGDIVQCPSHPYTSENLTERDIQLRCNQC